jgi:N-methylhydantoinase A/oxoprolinase/acetone carboxylase beta subunit
VVLGFIDADNFLGGRIKLDISAATRAIERRLCRRLELTVEQAAFRIRRICDESMARTVLTSVKAAGQKPGDVTLFSVGGAGPLHACRVAELAGLGQVVTFPFGSVFSAFGGGTSDVQHLYRHVFGDPAKAATELEAVADRMVHQARRDMQGEGFTAAEVSLAFAADLDGRAGAIEGRTRLDPEEFRRQLADATYGTPVASLAVTATSATPHWRQQARPGVPHVAIARKSRHVWWDSAAPTLTPVYDRESLTPGVVIAGPAIVAAADTTYAVFPGWRLVVNGLSFYVMMRN